MSGGARERDRAAPERLAQEADDRARRAAAGGQAARFSGSPTADHVYCGRIRDMLILESSEELEFQRCGIRAVRQGLMRVLF
jgi:hypothetical protein